MRIKPDRFPEKVIDAGDRFHAGKSAAGHHEIEQRRPGPSDSIRNRPPSRLDIKRLRRKMASPNDFIVRARSAKPGKLKKLVMEPRARITWSYGNEWQWCS